MHGEMLAVAPRFKLKHGKDKMNFAKFGFIVVSVLSTMVYAGVDEVNSFFTVSNHNVPANSEVVVQIFLRDHAGEAVNAEKVSLNISDSRVKIIRQPQAVDGAAGQYVAVIKAANGVMADIVVMADGVKIIENLLANPSFELAGSKNVPAGVGTYTNSYDDVWFGWNKRQKTAFRGEKSLWTIVFSVTRSAYLSFASFKGESVLHNHKYIYSIYSRYNNIRGERGVTMVISQTDANDKFLPNIYCGFRSGNSDEWVKIESEPITPGKDAVKMGASAMILAAGGEAYFDSARIRLTPTVCWGNFPAGKAVSSTDSYEFRIYNVNFALAIKPILTECEKALLEAEKLNANSPTVKDFKADFAKWRTALATKKSATEAYQIQLEMMKKIQTLRKASSGDAANVLDTLLGE